MSSTTDRQADRTPHPGAVSTLRRGVGFTGLAVASFLGCIDLTIVSTALPRITSELDTTLGVSQLVLSGFLTALAMFMVTAGRLGDRLGRRRILIAGLVLFVVASAAAALAPSIGWLVAGRFVQGAACAVLYTGTSTLVENLFDENERGRAIGLLYAVNGVGLAIGPVLGGLLVPTFGWASVFWINIPMGVLAIAAIVVTVPSPPGDPAVALDVPGQIALAATVAGVVAVASLPQTTGWVSLPVLVAGAVAVIGVIALLVVERRSTAPLLRIDLFTHPRFASALSSDFFLAAFYASALLVLPAYLAAAHGLDTRTTGLVLLLVSVTMAVLSPRVGRWVDRSGPTAPLRWGFAAFVVAAGAILAGATTGSLVPLLIGLVFFGAGWAAILAPATLAALASVGPDESGFAVGASWTFHNLGGALGAAVAAAIYAGSDDADLTGVASFLLAIAAIALVTSVVLARRVETHP